MPQQGNRPAGRVPALHIREIPGAHGHPPAAPAEPVCFGFRIMLQHFRFIRRDGGVFEFRDAFVQGLGQHLGVAERVMDAGRLSVLPVMRSAVQQAVRAAPVQQQVPVCRLREYRIGFAQCVQHRLASVGGTASPVGPFEIARSEAVVPRAVREHQVQVGPCRLPHDLHCSFVFHHPGVLKKGRERFLHIVADIYCAPAPYRSGFLQAALTVHQSLLRHTPAGKTGQLPGLCGHPVPAVITADQRHCRRVGGNIIDVEFLFRGNAVLKPPGHSEQAVFPFFSFSCLQQLSVVPECMDQADGAEYGGAVPRALRIIVQAAVITKHPG